MASAPCFFRAPPAAAGSVRVNNQLQGPTASRLPHVAGRSFRGAPGGFAGSPLGVATLLRGFCGVALRGGAALLLGGALCPASLGSRAVGSPRLARSRRLRPWPCASFALAAPCRSAVPRALTGPWCAPSLLSVLAASWSFAPGLWAPPLRALGALLGPRRAAPPLSGPPGARSALSALGCRAAPSFSPALACPLSSPCPRTRRGARGSPFASLAVVVSLCRARFASAPSPLRKTPP